MGTYVLTGGATGIGAAIKEKLRALGHRVVIIDLKEGDYLADLGDPKARQSVITKVATEVPVIDGLITCAGVASQFPDPGKFSRLTISARPRSSKGLKVISSRGGALSPSARTRRL